MKNMFAPRIAVKLFAAVAEKGRRLLMPTAAASVIFPSDSPFPMRAIGKHLRLFSIPIIFLFGVLAQFIVRPAFAASDTLYFLHTDHLGSTRAVTDRDGNVVASYDYYPYGSLREVGPQGGPTSTGAVERLFTSQIKDSSADLYFYNSRYYNPALGTFISPDPIQGPNRYAYVSGNPINMVDPSGNMLEIGGSGGGGILKPPPIEKRPWFVSEELIPEVKELYDVTLKTGLLATNFGEVRPWTTEEIFALEDLFKRLPPFMYRGRIIEHYYARGSSGGVTTLQGNYIKLYSSARTLSSALDVNSTEQAFVHEATHNITTPELEAEFVKIAAEEGITWQVANLTEAQLKDIGERERFLRRGYRLNLFGQLVRTVGEFPSEFAKTDPCEGLAEFSRFYYTNPSLMKLKYPRICDFFSQLQNNPHIFIPYHTLKTGGARVSRR